MIGDWQMEEYLFFVSIHSSHPSVSMLKVLWCYGESPCGIFVIRRVFDRVVLDESRHHFDNMVFCDCLLEFDHPCH